MIKASLFLFAAAALALADSPGDLGPTRIMSGSASLKSGITIRFATYAVPGGKGAAGYGEGGISDGVNAIHRFMKEPTNGRYFGYDLELTGDEASGYWGVFRPLYETGGSYVSINGERVHAAALKLPPPQPVRDGDTIALDIMASPDGTQRIVDYIQISLKPPEPAAASNNAEARDFTIDDGAITYDASAMTFWINGQKQAGLTGFTRNRGYTFWVAFPGRGRYILSLVPHDGFAKSGVVRDNVVAFQDGSQQYEVRFMGPVAGSGKAWNLYVLHDSIYQPAPQLRDAIGCGTERLENLVVGR